MSATRNVKPGYVPILRSGPADYWAWQSASPTEQTHCRPLFEVVPRQDKDGRPRTLHWVLRKFVAKVARNWPAASVLTVDTGRFLDQTRRVTRGSRDGAVFWTADELHRRNVQAKPVMRLDDGPQVLDEVQYAAALHGQGLACG